jgi:vacuolar iron transporter family protein
MVGNSEYFRRLYENEVFHYRVFQRLAEEEKNPHIKSILDRLSKEELKHLKMWAEIINTRKEPGIDDTDSFPVGAIANIRKVVGIALTVKIMEYSEVALEKELTDNINRGSFTQKQKSVIKRVKDSEKVGEDPLKDTLLGYSDVLSNIRSVIFGMNDGLVEILGAVAGFAAALQQPLLVIVAGLIVAIAGTLSMTGGAYLSVDYEKSVYKHKRTDSSKAAALYTGVAYILGALVPLLPFLLGFGGYYALGLSIIITAVILTLVSVLISIVSDTSILQRVMKTLLISLGIVAITITLGVFARSVLHINV